MIHWNDTHEEQLRAMSDAVLLEAYERTSGQRGDAAADALLAEIRRRGLDV
jgi:hypothetical protein